MNIERRVNDALLDLEGLLVEGASPDDAVAEVAGSYELKPEVLRVRASMLLNDPAAVKAKSDAAVETYGHRNALENVVRAYRELSRQGEDPSIDGLLESHLHGSFSSDERQYVFDQCMDIWLTTQINKINVIRSDQASKNAKHQ
ncbi:MAG: hypothetical protein ABI471_06795 [Sphingomonas bacterium]